LSRNCGTAELQNRARAAQCAETAPKQRQSSTKAAANDGQSAANAGRPSCSDSGGGPKHA